MNNRLRIAVLIDPTRTYRRSLLRGIAAYARVHGPWSFYHHEVALGKSLPAQLKRWDGDGILVRTEHASIVDELSRLKRPIVGRSHLVTSGRHWRAEPHSAIPFVDGDQEGVAQSAVSTLELDLVEIEYACTVE